MKQRTVKKLKRSGKPAKRVSALKKGRTGPGSRYLLQRGWWILRGAAIGVLVLLVLYGGYLGAGRVMELESLSVKHIEIDGCRTVKPESIRKLVGVAEGSPLLKVDLNRVRENVITHPSVRDATVVRELPDILRISIRERTPVAVLFDGQFATVDSEGVILNLHGSYPEEFPIITGVPGPLEPGRLVPELQPAMEALQSIARSGIMGPERISELRVDGKLVRVSLTGGGTVLVLGPGDKGSQVNKLARLMEAGVFETRSGGYDLRFGGRVIGMPDRKGYAEGETGLSPAGG